MSGWHQVAGTAASILIALLALGFAAAVIRDTWEEDE